MVQEMHSHECTPPPLSGRIEIIKNATEKWQRSKQITDAVAVANPRSLRYLITKFKSKRKIIFWK